MASTKPTPAQIAQKAIQTAKEAGYTLTVSDLGTANVVRINKSFTAGSNSEFVDCDATYYGVLSTVPSRGGSSWGTDGGGMGALTAIRTGSFVMQKSQCLVSVVKELVKQGIKAC